MDDFQLPPSASWRKVVQSETVTDGMFSWRTFYTRQTPGDCTFVAQGWGQVFNHKTQVAFRLKDPPDTVQVHPIFEANDRQDAERLVDRLVEAVGARNYDRVLSALLERQPPDHLPFFLLPKRYDPAHDRPFYDRTFIFSLYETQDFDTDLVFVHGMGGSAETTWQRTEGRDLWPQTDLIDFCRQNYPDLKFRILMMRHSMGKLSRNPRVAFQATSAFLSEAAFMAHLGRRKIIWLAHSLGGLLTKQILLTNTLLREKTAGVVFMGTPHRGSYLASTLHFFTRSQSANILDPNNHGSSQILSNLCEQYENWKIPTFNLVEKLPMPVAPFVKLLIVPPENATLDLSEFRNSEDRPLDDRHHGNICSFTSDDAHFRDICMFLDQWATLKLQPSSLGVSSWDDFFNEILQQTQLRLGLLQNLVRATGQGLYSIAESLLGNRATQIHSLETLAALFETAIAFLHFITLPQLFALVIFLTTAAGTALTVTALTIGIAGTAVTGPVLIGVGTLLGGLTGYQVISRLLQLRDHATVLIRYRRVLEREYHRTFEDLIDEKPPDLSQRLESMKQQVSDDMLAFALAEDTSLQRDDRATLLARLFPFLLISRVGLSIQTILDQQQRIGSENQFFTEVYELLSNLMKPTTDTSSAHSSICPPDCDGSLHPLPTAPSLISTEFVSQIEAITREPVISIMTHSSTCPPNCDGSLHFISPTSERPPCPHSDKEIIERDGSISWQCSNCPHSQICTMDQVPDEPPQSSDVSPRLYLPMGTGQWHTEIEHPLPPAEWIFKKRFVLERLGFLIQNSLTRFLCVSEADGHSIYFGPLAGSQRGWRIQVLQTSAPESLVYLRYSISWTQSYFLTGLSDGTLTLTRETSNWSLWRLIPLHAPANGEIQLSDCPMMIVSYHGYLLSSQADLPPQ